MYSLISIPTLSKAVQELAEQVGRQQEIITVLAQKCGLDIAAPVAKAMAAPEEVRQYEETFDCVPIVETPAPPEICVKEESNGTVDNKTEY